MKRKLITFLGLLLLVLLLAACGDKEEGGSAEGEAEAPAISDEEKLAEDELVVTVNEDEVTGSTYNLVYTQLKLHAMQTGQEFSDEDIKEMTIDSLIDRQLLMQQAIEDGIVITNEDAAEELESLRKENEEGLETLLEQYQISEDLFRQQLVFEMTMNDYVAEKINVTVTDEEVEEAYEEVKAEDDDIPELAEIRDTFKDQLENQRTSEALEKKIDELKEKADIKSHL